MERRERERIEVLQRQREERSKSLEIKKLETEKKKEVLRHNQEEALKAQIQEFAEREHMAAIKM